MIVVVVAVTIVVKGNQMMKWQSKLLIQGDSYSQKFHGKHSFLNWFNNITSQFMFPK